MKTMKYPVHISKRVALMLVTAPAIVVATGLLESGCSRGHAGNAITPQESSAKSNTCPSRATLDLSPSPLNSFKIVPVGSYLFPVEKEAFGNIDFDEDPSVQVSPPYRGTIIKTFVELGDRVQKDQALYTIKSPDLIHAKSTLIGAAVTLVLTNKELACVQGLAGVSEREKEQATSDQQTAERTLKAARDSVLVFGNL
jgi:cobalt-zinc-cadmium efflux system membrane fusion protein